MQQQSKEYKGLIQSGVFFAPIIPQLGFLLMYIYLFLKRSDFIDCVKKDFSNKLNAYTVTILTILAIISTIFTVAPVSVSILYLVYIIGIVLGFYAIRISTVAKEEFLKMYLYSVSIFTVFGILQWVFHIEVVKQIGPLLVNIYFFEGNRISSLAGNALVLSGLATFATIIGVLLFFTNLRNNIKYLFLFLAFIAFINVLLAQARSGIVIVALGLFLLVLVNFSKDKIVIISTLLISFFLCGFIVARYQNSFMIPPGSISLYHKSLAERFKDGSARVDLWEYSLVLIQQKPILGYGPDSWKIAMHNLVGEKFGDISDAHNTFLRLCVDFGVVFALILMGYILFKTISFYIYEAKSTVDKGLIILMLLFMFLGLIDNPLSSITMSSILIIITGLIWNRNKVLSL